MAVKPQVVKELRELTGAGMADCKKALEESDGDMQKAVEFLRKRGAASAAKRSDRSTDEGHIVAAVNDDATVAAMVQIDCETDFVARNAEFTAFCDALAQGVLNHNPADVDALLALEADGKSLQDYYNETLAKFSEKIVVSKFERIEASGRLTSYIHAGSKLGVLLEVTSQVGNEDGQAALRDIAMQVAAMRPTFATREEVSQDTLDKEREIFISQALEEGKKPEIAERVANGRIAKFYEENCLVEQAFVKDSGKTVTDVLKEIGDDVKVVRFLRYQLGQG
jgi:elongation factor Ts